MVPNRTYIKYLPCQAVEYMYIGLGDVAFVTFFRDRKKTLLNLELFEKEANLRYYLLYHCTTYVS